MRLMRIEEFSQRYFDETCRPALRKVLYWCEQGMLPARRIGKPWYVDIELFEKTHEGSLLDRIRTQEVCYGEKT